MGEIKMYSRQSWIDISKGLLIILVVIGHSLPGPYFDLDKSIDYIYLFHMPAFFILSGYLYKDSKMNLKDTIIKKVKRLLIPYVSYLLLMNIPILLKNLIYKQPISEFLTDIKYMILGGQYLNYNSGVLWFITCLFFTEVFFIITRKFINNDKINIFIIMILYTFAHLEAWFFKDIKLPFALDISLLSITYFSIGFYLKKHLINKNMLIISTIVSIFYISLLKLGLLNYGLELWGHNYTNYILDIIIPVSISLSIFNICKLIENKSIILRKLGMYTLPIMCLHISINAILSPFIISNHYVLIYTVLGVIIPYIIAKFLLEKNYTLSILFLGISKPTKSSSQNSKIA